jgi:hypothetical protein
MKVLTYAFFIDNKNHPVGIEPHPPAEFLGSPSYFVAIMKKENKWCGHSMH